MVHCSPKSPDSLGFVTGCKIRVTAFSRPTLSLSSHCNLHCEYIAIVKYADNTRADLAMTLTHVQYAPHGGPGFNSVQIVRNHADTVLMVFLGHPFILDFGQLTQFPLPFFPARSALLRIAFLDENLSPHMHRVSPSTNDTASTLLLWRMVRCSCVY